MRITYFGFGPTEIRALLFTGNLLTLAFGVIDVEKWFSPLRVFGTVSMHDLVITFLSLGAIGLIAVLAIREARVLTVEDPTPLGRK
jgi:hypothetical protein